jgi:hypothetical protein
VTSTRRAAVALGLCAAWSLAASAAPPDPRPGPKPAVLTADAWLGAPAKPATPDEIDRVLAVELAAAGIEPAPLTTDEQFLRRATLDLAGRLPAPADVAGFGADKDPHKRAKFIDRLLDSDDHARHWARYWQEVIASRLADPRGKALAGAFELWLTDELRKNRGWDEITRAMLTATGECRFDDGKAGAAFFLGSHVGPDSAAEQAAETARVFLGIRIQCAQCHDHPGDVWKREQFHQLAAYFARLRDRPVRDGQRLVGLELLAAPRGEHEMPSKADPRKTTTMHPAFLDGKAPRQGLDDPERRKALADAVVARDNYWFAGAYANRVWGELMGRSFYEPVDDLGPRKEVVLGPVLVRLASSFRATDCDVKAFFRLVCNTQAYQRQVRAGEAGDARRLFASASPRRLDADALWESLVGVLGNLGGPRDGATPRPTGPDAGRPGFEGLFKDEFGFDPSLRAEEVEGSVSQALLLMNSPAVNAKIRAQGTNLLARVLAANPDDDEALRLVYLRTLARKPTDREMDACRAHLKKAASRAEGFEDILWALLNSTEFLTKR